LSNTLKSQRIQVGTGRRRWTRDRLQVQARKGQLPFTLSAWKNILALHTPWQLRGPIWARAWAGTEDGFSPEALGLYL
jgi:hypothetical protein